MRQLPALGRLVLARHGDDPLRQARPEMPAHGEDAHAGVLDDRLQQGDAVGGAQRPDIVQEQLVGPPAREQTGGLEVKRRTKVIGRFPGETSCLSMCWAVLDLFLAGARGLGLSDLEYKQAGSMKIDHARRERTVNKVA
jgi:hypothetical protein